MPSNQRKPNLFIARLAEAVEYIVYFSAEE